MANEKKPEEMTMEEIAEMGATESEPSSEGREVHRFLGRKPGTEIPAASSKRKAKGITSETTGGSASNGPALKMSLAEDLGERHKLPCEPDEENE